MMTDHHKRIIREIAGGFMIAAAFQLLFIWLGWLRWTI
jgi:hypothetical protein